MQAKPSKIACLPGRENSCTPGQGPTKIMKLNFPTVQALHPPRSVVGQADLKTDQRPVTLVDGLTTTDSLGEPLKGRSNFLINPFP